MKRLISLLVVALFGVALVGCSDNEETTPPTPPDPEPVDVYGWHMTKWEVGGDDTNFPKEVYIVFDEEKNFEMYQDVSSNGFVKMTGTYTFDETSKKLTDVYKRQASGSRRYFRALQGLRRYGFLVGDDRRFASALR